MSDEWVTRLRAAAAWFGGDGDALPEVNWPDEEATLMEALLAETVVRVEALQAERDRLRAELDWYEANA